MERSDINFTNHLLTIELPSELYAALVEKIKTTGKTESELVIQGLQQVLNEDSEQDRFAVLESALEQKLKQYVESLVKDRVSASELVAPSANDNFDATLERKKAMPIPTIRPLKIGDRVLILDPDSPYYMAKLSVTRTSLIRAMVETDTGEHTFLKRDLRFIESTLD
jgi:hypothetical protein